MAVTAWGPKPVPTWLLVILAGISLGAAALAMDARGSVGEVGPRGRSAASLMAAGIERIAAARPARGQGLSAGDVNRTGLVGLAESPITSSVGVLTAKRTATNPNWAAVVTDLLSDAGVRPGDTVAAGFSGSFPGLNLATVAAAQAMQVRLLVITAVAASNWGANDPAFTWLDMESVLTPAGLRVDSLGASIGGVADAGVDLPPGGPRLLLAAIRRNGVPLIEGGSLAARVDGRMSLYTQAAGGRRIAAFVNVGGAQANLGGCDESFLVTSGLLHALPPCPGGRQGVAHRFLAAGVPVISLLNVRDLAVRYGLPIDPIPLPHPGQGGSGAGGRTLRPLVLLASLLAVLAAVLAGVQRGPSSARRPDALSGGGPIDGSLGPF